jgi:hypothetical protein
LISHAQQDLLQLENTEPDSLVEPSDKPVYLTEKTTALNKKKTIFDRLKEANPNLDI